MPLLLVFSVCTFVLHKSNETVNDRASLFNDKNKGIFFFMTKSKVKRRFSLGKRLILTEDVYNA